jgi:hypothetical protein
VANHHLMSKSKSYGPSVDPSRSYRSHRPKRNLLQTTSRQKQCADTAHFDSFRTRVSSTTVCLSGPCREVTWHDVKQGYKLTVFILASAGLAQSSSDGAFSVHQANHANFSLTPAQMREAESLYQSACLVVRHDFPTGAGEFYPPHFTVVIGADSNEVRGNIVHSNEAHSQPEIWLKKWNPTVFAEGSWFSRSISCSHPIWLCNWATAPSVTAGPRWMCPI